MRVILFAFLFSPTILFSQAPDYFANDPLWHCGYWDGDSWSNPPNPYNEEYVYYLHNDTSILGNIYKRVYRRGYRDYQNIQGVYDETFDEPTDFFIRQVGKTIRYYHESSNSDSLLVNYDYQVGDTLQGQVFQDCGYVNDTIYAVDSILINSEYRHVYYVDSADGAIITEGIGHQISADNHTGEFLVQLCEGMGFDYFVRCFGYGNSTVWESVPTGDCYVNLSVSEEIQIDFKLYPNPVSDYLIIDFNDNLKSEHIQIEITDLSGKKVHSESLSTSVNHHQLNISHLSSGMYFIIVERDTRTIHSEKFVVE